MQEKENAKGSLQRELQEELKVNNVCLTFIKTLPGTSRWQDEDFPILSHFYLAEFDGEMSLNEENVDFQFVDLKTINPSDIAFDSNQEIVSWLKGRFVFDIKRIKELTR